MPLGLNDRHQPFVNAFVVGGEYDLIKIREVAGTCSLEAKMSQNGLDFVVIRKAPLLPSRNG